MIRLLESNGWRLKATRGNHRQFLHPEKGLVVTVAGHPGNNVPPQRRSGTKRGALMMRYTVIYEKGPTSWGPTFPISLV